MAYYSRETEEYRKEFAAKLRQLADEVESPQTKIMEMSVTLPERADSTSINYSIEIKEFHPIT